MEGQIERTLSIIEMLADHPHGLALSEIAEELKVAKSATHRILTRLVARDFVHQDPATQHYRLSVRLAAIGFRYLAGSGINVVCQPELDSLAARTGEFVRIAAVSGERLIFVAEAQGARRGLRYEGEHGRRDVRLYATATGKAWLATLPEEDAVRLVLRDHFPDEAEFGPRTVRSIPELLTELARTRRQGYAISFEEGDSGVGAVAAAIPGIGKGEPAVGTIAVVGPITRLTRKRMMEIAPLVMAAAHRLGSVWPIREQQPKRAADAARPGSILA